MTDKNKGLLFAFIGIMILSFDSLLVRLAATDPWNVLFWRGLFQALSLIMFQLIFNRKQLLMAFIKPSAMLICVSIIFAASTICFVESLHYTQVASTIVIVNTAPLFTAILGSILLKEKLHKATIFAICIATAGIWIIFFFAPSSGQWVGNLFAIVTALSTAIYLIVMRKTKGEQIANYLILAGLIVASFSYFRGAQPLSISFTQISYLFLLGFIVIPAAYMFISKSPIYIPAAQTSLILLAEILFGPLYVYIILHEQASFNDIIGGGLILLTLGIYSIYMLKNEQS
ncbi:DMT family transporter [Shewanella marina]|uniref:DMT family transporter n=1 Tax=Shewanella marina TaxID=487319 RepID=UPI0004718A53|nr:DMT family transporter [Shewanella marina]